MIELASSAAHVVVASLDDLELSDDDHHHLARVLRLRPGEVVTATDGRGGWCWCRWNGAGLEADGEPRRGRAPAPPVGVAFAVLKGDRVDWIVQKLTEVGVDVIVPMTTQRCVVRWDAAKAAAQLGRLRRIAREATMQSRRVWLPDVRPLTDVADVLAAPGSARADYPAPDLAASDSLELSLIAVGPEGGWADAERDRHPAAVQLGELVFRAETAALAAGLALVARRRNLTSER